MLGAAAFSSIGCAAALTLALDELKVEEEDRELGARSGIFLMSLLSSLLWKSTNA